MSKALRPHGVQTRRGPRVSSRQPSGSRREAGPTARLSEIADRRQARDVFGPFFLPTLAISEGEPADLIEGLGINGGGAAGQQRFADFQQDPRGEAAVPSRTAVSALVPGSLSSLVRRRAIIRRLNLIRSAWLSRDQ